MTPVELAHRMWPTVPRANLEINVPHIVAGLVKFEILEFLRVAFATVGVEVGPFIPISEYISRHNTAPGGPPFALYDFRRDIGNDAVGDGARYKGRGYIQITGRANYRDIGAMLGMDLEHAPQIANEPQIAGLILAAFLHRCKDGMRDALARGDLKKARKLVNGGSHGLNEFIAAFRRG